MALFHKQVNTQAYLKAGIMGFAGTGKTYTSTELAIGLIRYLREREIPGSERPAYFLDTETGADWVAPNFAEAGIELNVAKTRAFVDLIPAIKEAEKDGSVLMIDSITHFWRELTETYARKKGRHNGLAFQDWAWLKGEWGRFTDTFVNSGLHIIMAGRAGYEYDFFESDSGKKELEKTGIKMKAETETGYEPSLLILMERHFDMETKTVYRTASVLKDRADLLDGKTFRNPTFKDFLPHIERLNLGGEQLGIEDRNSDSMISRNGKTEWQYRKEQVEIMLDEIQTLMVKHYPTTSKDDKLSKIALMETYFDTRSWKRIEGMSLEDLKTGFQQLCINLEGYDPYDKEIAALPNIDDEKDALEPEPEAQA